MVRIERPDDTFEPDPKKRAANRKAALERLKHGGQPKADAQAIPAENASTAEPQDVDVPAVTEAASGSAAIPTLATRKSLAAGWAFYHSGLAGIPDSLRASAQRKMILRLVSRTFDQSPEDILHAGRESHRLIPRFIAMLFIHLAQPKLPLKQLDAIFQKEHRVAANAIQSIKEKMQSDKKLFATIADLAKKFKLEFEFHNYLNE